MGELMTAKDLAVFAGNASADQDGKFVDEDTRLYAIDHPPFITVAPDRAEKLYGLKPPKGAVADWNREVPTNGLLETWEKVNYEKQYKNMLSFNPQAEKDLFEIRMALKAKDVCIVSGSPLYPYCPRGIVYRKLTEELNNG